MWRVFSSRSAPSVAAAATRRSVHAHASLSTLSGGALRPPAPARSPLNAGMVPPSSSSSTPSPAPASSPSPSASGASSAVSSLLQRVHSTVASVCVSLASSQRAVASTPLSAFAASTSTRSFSQRTRAFSHSLRPPRHSAGAASLFSVPQRRLSPFTSPLAAPLLRAFSGFTFVVEPNPEDEQPRRRRRVQQPAPSDAAASSSTSSTSSTSEHTFSEQAGRAPDNSQMPSLDDLEAEGATKSFADDAASTDAADPALTPAAASHGVDFGGNDVPVDPEFAASMNSFYFPSHDGAFVDPAERPPPGDVRIKPPPPPGANRGYHLTERSMGVLLFAVGLLVVAIGADVSGVLKWNWEALCEWRSELRNKMTARMINQSYKHYHLTKPSPRQDPVFDGLRAFVASGPHTMEETEAAFQELRFKRKVPPPPLEETQLAQWVFMEEDNPPGFMGTLRLVVEHLKEYIPLAKRVVEEGIESIKERARASFNNSIRPTYGQSWGFVQAIASDAWYSSAYGTILGLMTLVNADFADMLYHSEPYDEIMSLIRQDTSNLEHVGQGLGLLKGLTRHPHTADLLLQHPGFVNEMLDLLGHVDEGVALTALETLHQALSFNTRTDMFAKDPQFPLTLLQLAARSSYTQVADTCVEMLQHFFLTNPEYVRENARTFSPRIRDDLFALLTNSASHFQEKGLSQHAVELFKQAMYLDMHPGILVQVGVGLNKMGLVEQARKYFDKALSVNPRQLEPAFVTARALIAEDVAAKTASGAAPLDAAALRATLSKAVDILLTGLQELKEKDAELLRIRFQNAMLARENARPGAKYQPLRPEPPSTPPPYVTPAYDLLITLLERLGRQAEAVSHARAWALRCFTDPVAHYTLGRLLSKDNDFAGAINALGVANTLMPVSPETHAELAVAQYRLQKYDEAATEAEEAFRLASEKAAEHATAVRRARHLRNQRAEKERKAHSFFTSERHARVELVDESAPVAVPAPLRLVMQESALLQALALYHRRLFEPAAEAFARTLEVDPHNSRALFGRAQCLQALGREEESVALYAETLRVLRDRAGQAVQSGRAASARAFFAQDPRSKKQLDSIGRLCAAAEGSAAGQRPEVRELIELYKTLSA